MQPVKTDEYTVWLEPSPAAGEPLRRVIADIAARAGTPEFEPHVTLLPGLHGDEQALIAGVGRLAAQGPLPLSFSGPKTGTLYHKCFYLECEPSAALLQLRRRGEESLGVSPEFRPHFSLAYGISDEALKAALVGELGHKRFGFTAERISLWRARGLVEEWRKVAEYPL